MPIARQKRSKSLQTPSLSGFFIRAFFILLGFACVIGGTAEMLSHLVQPHATNTAEATVIGRRTACILEYQFSNESDPRREPMACDKADAFVHANPGRHVHVERHDLLNVRYPLAGGGMREAEAKVSRPGRLPPRIGIGSTIAIQYALSNPADVQVVATLSSLMDLVFLIGTGIVVLLISICAPGPAKAKPISIRRSGAGALNGIKLN